jgi:hypothetical protein
MSWTSFGGRAESGWLAVLPPDPALKTKRVGGMASGRLHVTQGIVPFSPGHTSGQTLEIPATFGGASAAK